MHAEVSLSAPMEYLVYRGSRHPVLPDQIADANMICMIVIVQLLPLYGGEPSAFVDCHIVYSNPMDNCKQR